MPNNTNSASRAAKILRAAATQVPHAKLINVWGSAFSVATKSISSQIIIVHKIGLLHNQIMDAWTKMRHIHVSDDIYDEAFQKSLKALNIENMSQQWVALRDNLDGATFKTWDFCSQLLPNEEEQLPAAALECIS